jgi:hypothetical protein
MTDNKRIQRDPSEFSIQKEPDFDYCTFPPDYEIENCKGIGICINEKEITPGFRYNKDGVIELSKYTPEYAFFKKRCCKCNKKYVEKSDPKSVILCGVDSKSIPEKYKPYFISSKYSFLETRRDLSKIHFSEIVCSDSNVEDEMIPDRRILIKKDLLSCNENLPAGFSTGREYFLAFKKNYIFFFNLVPIVDRFIELSDKKREFLSQFGKYSFKFSQVIVNSSDGNVKKTHRVVISKVEDKPLPPMLADINNISCVFLYESWIDQTPIQVFMKEVLDKLYNTDLSSGDYSYSIDDKVLLNVKVSIMEDAFKNEYDKFRVKTIALSPTANNYQYTIPEGGGMPEFDVKKEDDPNDTTEDVTFNSYRYEVECIQLCE